MTPSSSFVTNDTSRACFYCLFFQVFRQCVLAWSAPRWARSPSPAPTAPTWRLCPTGSERRQKTKKKCFTHCVKDPICSEFISENEKMGTLHSFSKTFYFLKHFSSIFLFFVDPLLRRRICLKLSPLKMSLADSLSAQRPSWGLLWTTLWTPPVAASGPPAKDNPATTGIYSSQSPLIQSSTSRGCCPGGATLFHH